MGIFSVLFPQRDFYVVELRSVTANGRGKLSSWYESGSLKTGFIAVLGCKSFWSAERSLRFINAADNDLLSQRDMDVFDDARAAQLYFERMNSLFSNPSFINTDWVSHRVFLWRVTASSRTNAMHRLDELGSDPKVLAETDFKIILAQLRTQAP